MLEKPDLSLHSRIAIKLRLAEKDILERAVTSGRTKRLHFQKQLDEGVPLPLYEESDIALLENADAKLPIILRKLEEEDERLEEEMNLVEMKPDEASLAAYRKTVLNGGSKDVNGTQEDPPGGDAVPECKETGDGVEKTPERQDEPRSKRTEDEAKEASE